MINTHKKKKKKNYEFLFNLLFQISPGVQASGHKKVFGIFLHKNFKLLRETFKDIKLNGPPLI